MNVKRIAAIAMTGLALGGGAAACGGSDKTPFQERLQGSRESLEDSSRRLDASGSQVQAAREGLAKADARVRQTNREVNEAKAALERAGR